ncbi:hypothetical protein GSI_04812 [Ganoderma sinense ZZ0214-1]|uniref:Uncharacterized protein n=1 Tax=Ganoderma sinense ZZ0214-1 TaxID=1077348 RepID=A0A2G8SHY3_9APHY|nr:hypothetical protein GSI_04812 [Ganoderma sinense ZZ0214-1]
MPSTYLGLPALPSPVEIDQTAADMLTDFVIRTIQLHPRRARDDTGPEQDKAAAGDTSNSSGANSESEEKGDGEGKGEESKESVQGRGGGGEAAVEGEAKGARIAADGLVGADDLDGTEVMKKFHVLLRGVSPFLCADTLFVQLLRFLERESLLCAEEAAVWKDYYTFLSRRRQMSTAMGEVAGTLSRIRGVNEARARARAKQTAEGGEQADAEMADADVMLSALMQKLEFDTTRNRQAGEEMMFVAKNGTFWGMKVEFE